MKNNTEELCKAVNAMELVQSVNYEQLYDPVTQSLDCRLTMIFPPSLRYDGESLLKVTFFHPAEFDVETIYHLIRRPFIEVHDISDRQWEHGCYVIADVEDYFRVTCEGFETEWLPPEEWKSA